MGTYTVNQNGKLITPHCYWYAQQEEATTQLDYSSSTKEQQRVALLEATAAQASVPREDRCMMTTQAKIPIRALMLELRAFSSPTQRKWGQVVKNHPETCTHDTRETSQLPNLNV